MKRLKILISAYACSPSKGSEPGMGWNFIINIAKHHDLWIITEKDEFEQEIREFLSSSPEMFSNIKFFYVRRKHHEILRKIWPPSYYWFYRIWQKKAYQLACELHNEIHFDLIHQLNMVGFREPGYLWKIKEVPFVWGPIGGLENTPWTLLPDAGFPGAIFYGIRNIMNSFQRRFMKRPKLAATRPRSELITATPDTRRIAKELWGSDSTIICEVGPAKDIIPQNISSRDTTKPLKIIWSGQHTPGKALNILLRSLARIQDTVNFQLEILGTGSETEKWKILATSLGISSQCVWHGWIPREKALEIMTTGHIFCLTSLKELTASVTLEALSAGLPIICLDLFGFAHVVDDSCGIKVQITTRLEVRKKMADAVKYLAENETRRLELGHGAIVRAQEFNWEKKAERLNDIYLRLIEGNE